MSNFAKIYLLVVVCSLVVLGLCGFVISALAQLGSMLLETIALGGSYD